MDDGPTAPRNRPGRRPSSSAASRFPLHRGDPQHRRRRAVALIALAGIALIVGIIAGAGGGSVKRAPVSRTPPGFFNRIAVMAGVDAGSFAAAEQSAESAAIDRTLAYTPYVRVAGSQHREIALTFDDGPGPYTPQILAILEREHVPATFFEVGALERYFSASTTQIVADGYPIGDHTETHAPMSKLSARDQQTQLLQQTSAIGDHGAAFPRLFRPPYGLWSPTTISLLRRYRMLMVLWSVDTEDYRLPGASAIVSSVISGARPGAIVLMHDAGGNRLQSIEALSPIIAALRARGYRMVTVPRLLLDNPAPAQQLIPGGLVGAGG